MNDLEQGTGADMPAQDSALVALAALLEEIGEQAGMAFVGGTAQDDATFDGCTQRAEAVARCIIALPAITLHGASAKAKAARATSATSLLERSLVDSLARDMHADVTRLRAPMEGAGHA